jgi:regulator of sigma D
VTADSAPRKISYDHQLVPRLKADHQNLLALYTEIKIASDNGNYASIPQLLKSFRLVFQTHIAIESVKFYVYLKQHLADNSDLGSFVVDVRREMNEIASALTKFTNTYGSDKGIREEEIDIFKRDLDAIGEVFVKRINLEENHLYTLYLPNY